MKRFFFPSLSCHWVGRNDNVQNKDNHSAEDVSDEEVSHNFGPEASQSVANLVRNKVKNGTRLRLELEAVCGNCPKRRSGDAPDVTRAYPQASLLCHSEADSHCLLSVLGSLQYQHVADGWMQTSGGLEDTEVDASLLKSKRWLPGMLCVHWREWKVADD